MIGATYTLCSLSSDINECLAIVLHVTCSTLILLFVYFQILMNVRQIMVVVSKYVTILWGPLNAHVMKVTI